MNNTNQPKKEIDIEALTEAFKHKREQELVTNDHENRKRDEELLEALRSSGRNGLPQ